jgi:homogentisate 1,2-dioxygenase
MCSGILFSVNVDEPSRGYICEVFNGHYELPNLGPIGSNGLANSRDFETPSARFEDRDVACFARVHKFNGKLFSATQKHSPFDVVAWHGKPSVGCHNFVSSLCE